MGAILKQLATYVAGNMASGSGNKAKFIVKTARTGYIVSGLAVGGIWYASWRNEHTTTGSGKFPFPGASNLAKIGKPDRPEKEFKHVQKAPAETWGNSEGRIPKNRSSVSTIPTLTGVPQTPADAAKYKGLGTFEGKPVAMWILPYLNYAKAHGWRGTLTQGFRTYAEEVQIYNSGVRPAAHPGSSNHGKKNFPGGAVDVSEAEQLSQILKAIPGGSLLKWAGAKDPVHFSYPHNGSY